MSEPGAVATGSKSFSSYLYDPVATARGSDTKKGSGVSTEAFLHAKCQKPDREGGLVSRELPLLTRGLLTRGM